MLLKITLVLTALCLTSIIAVSQPNAAKRHRAIPPREYLYVVADGLYGYKTQANGRLEKIDTGFPLIGQFPYSVVSSYRDHFLYVCGVVSPNNNRGGTLYGYNIAIDGKLTFVHATNAGSIPDVMAFHPSGRFFYCVSLDAPKKKNVIFEYHVKRDGALTPLTSHPINIDAGAISSLAFAKSGHFLFLTLHDKVMRFRVSPNGTLHLTPVFSLRTNGSAYISTNSSGTCAYVASAGDNKLNQFRILNDGSLIRLTRAAIRTGKNPTSITISPFGRFLYAVCDDGISQFRIGTAGTLSPLPHPLLTFDTLRGRLAVTRSGRFAYLTITGGNETGYVKQFSIQRGLLTPFKHPFVPAGINPISLVVVQR